MTDNKKSMPSTSNGCRNLSVGLPGPSSRCVLEQSLVDASHQSRQKTLKKKGSSVSSKSRGPKTKKKFLEDVYSHQSIRKVELKKAEKSIKKQMKSCLWNCKARHGTQQSSCTIDGRALRNYNTVDAFEFKGQRYARRHPNPTEKEQDLQIRPNQPVYTNLNDRQLVDILTSSHDDQANQIQRN